MATTTTNLGLTKPAGTEKPDISVINSNMDKIDTAVGQNGYGEIAGGKNLFFYNDNVEFEENSNEYQSFTFDSKTDNSVRCYVPNSGSYTGAKLNIYGLKPNTKYSASCSVTENTSEFSPRIYCTESDSDGTLAVNLSLNNGATMSGSGYYVTFSNIQVEEGETETKYEPYFPSNKMLREEKIEFEKNLGDSVVTKNIRLSKDENDYYRDIYPISGEPYIMMPDFIIEGGYSSKNSSLSEPNRSCAMKCDVYFDILDPEITGAITKGGITVTYKEKSRTSGQKFYTVKGTATEDMEIPLYSVTNPKNATLMFRSDGVTRMSSTKYYIKISDETGGNLKTIGEDGSGKVTANLSEHSGKVTVYLVVKAGTKSFSNINVKCGYTTLKTTADYSIHKYSDDIDNVIDAVLALKDNLDNTIELGTDIED